MAAFYLGVTLSGLALSTIVVIIQTRLDFILYIMNVSSTEVCCKTFLEIRKISLWHHHNVKSHRRKPESLEPILVHASDEQFSFM